MYYSQVYSCAVYPSNIMCKRVYDTHTHNDKIMLHNNIAAVNEQPTKYLLLCCVCEHFFLG